MKLILLLLLSLSAIAKDIKVYVIDTGVDINSRGLSRYVTKDSDYDRGIHGTAVTSLIAYGVMGTIGQITDTICSNVKITVCSFYKNEATPLKDELNCLNKITPGEYDIIHMSLGGERFSFEEYKGLDRVLKQGTILVAAAGNNGKDISKTPYYPASLATLGLPVTIVGNGASYDDRSKKSNYLDNGVEWVYGDNMVVVIPNNKMTTLSGTSISAALYTHKLLKERCDQWKRN